MTRFSIVICTLVLAAAVVSATVTLPTGRTWQVALIAGNEGERIKSLAKAYVEANNGGQSVNMGSVAQDRDDYSWYVFQALTADEDIMWILQFNTGYTSVVDGASGPFEDTRDAEMWTRDYDRDDFRARARAIEDAEA